MNNCHSVDLSSRATKHSMAYPRPLTEDGKKHVMQQIVVVRLSPLSGKSTNLCEYITFGKGQKSDALKNNSLFCTSCALPLGLCHVLAIFNLHISSIPLLQHSESFAPRVDRETFTQPIKGNHLRKFSAIFGISSVM